MPAINPNDYNIDKININTSELTLGVYNTVDFTNYTLGRNFTTPTTLVDINVPESVEQVTDLPGVIDTSYTPHPNSLSNIGIIYYNLGFNFRTPTNTDVINIPIISEQISDLPDVIDTSNSLHPNTLSNQSIIDFNLDKNFEETHPTVSRYGYDLTGQGDMSSSFPIGSEPRNVNEFNDVLDVSNSPHPNSLSNQSIINHNLGMNQGSIHYTILNEGSYNLGGLGETVNIGGEQQIVIEYPNVGTVATTSGIHPSLLGQSPLDFNLQSNQWSHYATYQYNVGDQTLQPWTNTSQVETYNVSTINLNNVGSVTLLVNNSGEVSSTDYLQEVMLKDSKYGPKYIKSSLDSTLIDSGLREYQTSAGGTLLDGFIGRQLGFGLASGIDFDSELGDIGIEQREFNTKERIRLNFVQETAGRINLDPFGLATGQDLLWKDYKITRPKGFLGRVAQFTANLTGLNLPTDIIPNNATTNDLLERTGGATRGLIYDAISRNKFGPSEEYGFERAGQFDNLPQKDKKFLGEILDDFKNSEKPKVTSYTDDLSDNEGIDELNNVEVKDLTSNPSKSREDFNVSPSQEGDGYYSKKFKGLDNTSDNGELHWKPGTKKAKRGLLRYTQQLLDKFGEETDSVVKYLNKENHDDLSQGNRVKNKDGKYCRSWSTTKQYKSYGDLVRNDELIRAFMGKNLSILEDGTGLPKIVPYNSDFENGSLYTTENPSKYMLSLENLAWEGSPEFNVLPNVEQGPNGGRIMWFPPYDINFTDNTSVSWETTNFIGRGEPIYTYNHTERKGTLDFKIIIDHPSALNAIKEDTTGILEEYFAGCDDLGLFKDLYGSNSFIDTTSRENLIRDGEKNISELEVPEPKPFYGEDITFYFQNAKTEGNKTGRDVVFDLGQGYELGSGELNSTFSAQTKELIDFLLTPDGKRYRINIESNTSGSASKEYNQKLSEDRANSLKQYLFNKLTIEEKGKTINYPVRLDGRDISFYKESENKTFRWGKLTTNGERNATTTDNTNPDDIKAKLERNARITLEYNPEIDDYMLKTKLPKGNEDFINNKKRSEEERARKVADTIVNEATYFTKLTETDEFIYDDIREKIEHFHPAFHSMTPEGFNSRLSFLQQCTRQGPTIKEGSPRNMAFGKPPICVLRVGDFYHTKIVIDAVNFTFDPLQWDLNPEGVGVQPMLCSVSLSFSFIGGSSLGGPISQLQNAVSENFFANTSIHRRRREYQLTNSEGENIGDSFEYGAYVTPNEEITKVNKNGGDTNVVEEDVITKEDINNSIREENNTDNDPVTDGFNTTTYKQGDINSISITDNTSINSVFNLIQIETEITNGFKLDSDYKTIVYINDNLGNKYVSSKGFTIKNSGTSSKNISLSDFQLSKSTSLQIFQDRQYVLNIDIVNEFGSPIETLSKTL